METLAALLTHKGTEVTTVSPQASAHEAGRVMAEEDIGALLVMEGEKPVGIVSERDLARKVLLQGRAPKEVTVREVMTEHVVYVRLEQTLEEAMALMIGKGIRHLPVFDGGRLKGILSIRDVVESVISEHKFTIQQLENYISRG